MRNKEDWNRNWHGTNDSYQNQEPVVLSTQESGASGARYPRLYRHQLLVVGLDKSVSFR